MPQTNKRGLGKGLGALIPQGSVFTGGRTILNIDVGKIVPNPHQPRTIFRDESIRELADSIKSKGVAQPILVRMKKGAYELVAGERRFRAAKLAGLAAIPAIVKDFSDEESIELSLIENLQREDLNPMDEAESYSRLIKQFNLTQDEIAKKVSKSRSNIGNMLRLLDLPEEMRKALRKGDLTVGHGRALLAIEDKEKRLLVYRDVVKNKLSVRDIEILVYGGPKTDEGKKGKSKKAKAEPANPEIQPFVEKISNHLMTKVRIRGTTLRGRIEIDYYSQEDLERLLELITSGKIEKTQEVTEIVQ